MDDVVMALKEVLGSADVAALGDLVWAIEEWRRKFPASYRSLAPAPRRLIDTLMNESRQVRWDKARAVWP